jgi:hypothetical protein
MELILIYSHELRILSREDVFGEVLSIQGAFVEL